MKWATSSNKKNIITMNESNFNPKRSHFLVHDLEWGTVKSRKVNIKIDI